MSRRVVVVEFDKDLESIKYLTEVLRETRICCNAYILGSGSPLHEYYDRAVQSLLFVKCDSRFPNKIDFMFPKRSKTQYRFDIIDQNRINLSIRRPYGSDPFRMDPHIGLYETKTVTAHDILDGINQGSVSEVFDM